MQEEGLTNEGRHHLLLLHKQAHDKSSIAELLHNRARLTACEMGVIFERNMTTLKNIPTPSLRSPLPMGIFVDTPYIANERERDCDRHNFLPCFYGEKCE